MCKRRDVLLRRLAAGLACLLLGGGCPPALHAAARDDGMPERAAGTFVQRKTLADVDVTITSRGTFRFERGRFFEWNTQEPLPSTVLATPTNYAMTVNGRTTAHRLENDVTSIVQIFEIKEVKEFVQSVTAVPETGFPDRVSVAFRNGDRLEIELRR